MKKSKKMSVFKKRVKRKIVKGFTLLELMIVMAIIAILLAMELEYREKATISHYPLPIAQRCVMDIINHCIENLGNSVNFVTLPNCADPEISITGGNVKLEYFNTSVLCNVNESINRGSLFTIIPESRFRLEIVPKID